jgi:hypothetical protein
MSAKFYDKEDIKFYNELQDISGRLDQIHAAFQEEQAYLHSWANIYKKHDAETHKRIASLIKEGNKWTGLAAFVGGVVGALTVWELVRDVRWVLKWIGGKMAKQETSSANSQQRRLHARDWNY